MLIETNQYEITVLYTSYPNCVSKDSKCDFLKWGIEYKKKGIKFIPLKIEIQNTKGFYELQISYKTFLYLKNQEKNFDIIYFHDYIGTGNFFLKKRIL